MPVTNDYQAVANVPGSDVVSQADYLTLLAPSGDLYGGYKTGVAQSDQFNKTIRQVSVFTSAFTQFVADTLAENVLDDGNVPALEAQIIRAIQQLIGSPFTTGDIKLTMKVVADVGWVLCNDGTIGNAGSGASTRANADCAALFTLLWNNVINTWAPVSGGRGASAAADFAALKTIGLTKMLGRSLAVYGSGAGLSNRALGQSLGEESHVQAAGEVGPHNHVVNDPGHTHSVSDPGHVHAIFDPGHAHGISDPGHAHTIPIFFSGGGGAPGTFDQGITGPIATNSAFTGIAISAATTGIATVSHATGIALFTALTGIILSPNSPAGQAFNIMQPTTFLNAMIKL